MPGKMLRFGLAIDESVLYAIGDKHSENLYAAMNYFSRVHSPANDRFHEAYHECFGEGAPPINIACQSCYDGVHVVASLARSNGMSLAKSGKRPAARNAVRRALGEDADGPHAQGSSRRRRRHRIPHYRQPLGRQVVSTGLAPG